MHCLDTPPFTGQDLVDVLHVQATLVVEVAHFDKGQATELMRVSVHVPLDRVVEGSGHALRRAAPVVEMHAVDASEVVNELCARWAARPVGFQGPPCAVVDHLSSHTIDERVALGPRR